MVLYHASSKKRLTTIKPQRTLSHDKYIGDYVFATKSKTMALMYLTAKGLPALMNPEKPTPNIVICASPKEYISQDVGGAVYELSDKNFLETPQKGIEKYEMVSQVAAKPLQKTLYSKSLDAMLSAGIEVRFVDEKTFNLLLNNPKQSERIQQIQKYYA